MSPARRPRAPLAPRRRKREPLLAADVNTVDYKDVDLLRRFVSDRGKIRPRRVTGLTPQQQRQVTKAVKNAREMALLPYTSLARPTTDARPERKTAS